MMGWLTDQVGAAAAGAAVTTIDLASYDSITPTELAHELVPTYIQAIPAWTAGSAPTTSTSTPCRPSSSNVMAIRSAGQGGVADTRHLHRRRLRAHRLRRRTSSGPTASSCAGRSA